MHFLEVLSKRRRDNKEVGARVIPAGGGEFHLGGDQTLGMGCPERVLISPSLKELKTEQHTGELDLIGANFNEV